MVYAHINHEHMDLPSTIILVLLNLIDDILRLDMRHGNKGNNAKFIFTSHYLSHKNCKLLVLQIICLINSMSAKNTYHYGISDSHKQIDTLCKNTLGNNQN